MGVEFGIPKEKPMPSAAVFPWIIVDVVAPIPLAIGEWDEIADPQDVGHNIGYYNALANSGLMHIAHNAVSDLLAPISVWDATWLGGGC